MSKPVKENITFEDLSKVDIRVGEILSLEKPEEVVGKQALFVLNLAPKKMAGEISEGMLFDIGYESGITPVLAEPEKTVPNGAIAG